MKKLTLLLSLVLILTGCPIAFEIPERVQLKIHVVGLDFQSGEADTLKSAPKDVFSEFEHNYAHTDISMYREGANYNISTGSIGQGVSTSIAVGTYQVYGYGGYASPLGMAELSFILPDQDAVVKGGSSTMDLEAIPDCGLILVADIYDQVKTAYISGEGNQRLAFFQQGYFWYTYFSPQPGFQAHLEKKNGGELLMNTGDLHTGWMYKVEVTMD